MHPYISILTIFLAVLMAYRNWNVNKNTIYLSGFIFVIALYSLIHYVLLINKDVFLLAVFYNNNAPIGFLAGPLLYFYVRGTLFDNRKLTKKDLLHLIPALINTISITPYVLTPFSYKLALAERLVKDAMVARTFTVGMYPNIVNMIARPTLLCIYTISSLAMLYHFYQKAKKNNSIDEKQMRRMLIWLSCFLSIILFAVVSFAVISYLFLREPHPDLQLLLNSTPMNIVGICLLMIPVSLLVFPELLYGIPQINEDEKILFLQPNVISTDVKNVSEKEVLNEDVDPRFIELSESILLYIKESEIFLNPDFSMEELSRSMNVPKHHLYYCFNSILNIKFTKLRSELRVEYAKKLIEDGLLESLTLDAIGNKAGFSSRSSFQSTFKDEVGCTPGMYLKFKTEI